MLLCIANIDDNMQTVRFRQFTSIPLKCFSLDLPNTYTILLIDPAQIQYKY